MEDILDPHFHVTVEQLKEYPYDPNDDGKDKTVVHRVLKRVGKPPSIIVLFQKDNKFFQTRDSCYRLYLAGHIIEGYEIAPVSAVTYSRKSHTKLLNPVKALMLFEAFVESGGKFNLGTIFEWQPMIAITPFFALPGFADIYTSYLLGPDSGCEIIGIDTAVAEIITSCGFPTEHPTPHMEDMVLCIATLVSLAANKTIPTIQEAKKYKIRRSKAVGQVLGSRAINDTSIESFVDEKALMDMNSLMSSLPILRRAVNSFILDSAHPICVHIRGLLKDTQLTHFSMIHTFILGYPKTRLHTYRPLMNELDKWAQVFKRIYTTFGSSWPYYRLLAPHDAATSPVNWKNLACAAYCYALCYGRNATLSDLRGADGPTSLFLSLACQELDEEAVKEGEAAGILSDATYKILEESGVDHGLNLTFLSTVSTTYWKAIDNETRTMAEALIKRK